MSVPEARPLPISMFGFRLSSTGGLLRAETRRDLPALHAHRIAVFAVIGRRDIAVFYPHGHLG
jgi:hypothetical protein